MSPWFAPFPRRTVLVAAGSVLLGACATADYSYVSLMKQDPMYSWHPTVPTRRTESVMPATYGGVAGDSRTSDILIRFYLPAPGDVSALIAEAVAARQAAGYQGDRRPLTPKVAMSCYIGPLDGHAGLLVILSSPA